MTNIRNRRDDISTDSTDLKKKIKQLFFGCIGSSLLRVGFLQLRRAGATLRCSARASHCSGFSCWGAQALGVRASVVVARGISSHGSGAQDCGLSIVAHGLQITGSVVVAHGLSCSVACGIFPDQGLNPCPCVGRRILNHCTTREVPDSTDIKRISEYLINIYANKFDNLDDMYKFL